MRGMDKKASDGHIQYRVPYGYKIEDGNAIIDEEKAKDIVEIFKSYLELQSTLKVARGLGFSKTFVLRVLRNPIYCGGIKWNNMIYDGMHDPIIDKTVFDEVAQILDENRKN